MTNENLFRWIMIAGLVLMLPVGLYHRIRAQSAGDKLDRRAEGWFILLTLRPVAAIATFGFIAYMIDPNWMRWSSVPLPTWLRWIGVGLGVIGAVLAIAVFRFLGMNITDTVVTRAKHTLVIDGPYRWVRHPFYLAFLIAVVAATLVTANWFIALFSIASWLLVVKRTKTEEARLVERFGDQYRQYMERTGRFFPRI